MSNSTVTIDDLLRSIREQNPGKRFARHKRGECIGVWVEQWGRFAACLCMAITGEWVMLPYEVLLSGKPPYGPEDWEE
jgi:hypothetical protein